MFSRYLNLRYFILRFEKKMEITKKSIDQELLHELYSGNHYRQTKPVNSRAAEA